MIIGTTSMITGFCREFSRKKDLIQKINAHMNVRTMVSPEMSSQERNWWHDERYTIYDLNVNSIAAYPQHEETLDLDTAGSMYTAKGYAYAGGGRRITRVEISLDKGKCEFPALSFATELTCFAASLASLRDRIRRRQIPRLRR